MKDKVTYCCMSGCDWEATEGRESPVTGVVIDLCYQCSQAYDLGVCHGQMAMAVEAKE